MISTTFSMADNSLAEHSRLTAFLRSDPKYVHFSSSKDDSTLTLTLKESSFSPDTLAKILLPHPAVGQTIHMAAEYEPSWVGEAQLRGKRLELTPQSEKIVKNLLVNAILTEAIKSAQMPVKGLLIDCLRILDPNKKID
jgi:hypothetical protein